MNKLILVAGLLAIAALYIFLKPETCTTPHLYCTTIAPGFTEPSRAFCDYDDAREWVKVTEYKKGNVMCFWRE